MATDKQKDITFGKLVDATTSIFPDMEVKRKDKERKLTVTKLHEGYLEFWMTLQVRDPKHDTNRAVVEIEVDIHDPVPLTSWMGVEDVEKVDMEAELQRSFKDCLAYGIDLLDDVAYYLNCRDALNKARATLHE